jgi:hypothetical protein
MSAVANIVASRRKIRIPVGTCYSEVSIIDGAMRTEVPGRLDLHRALLTLLTIHNISLTLTTYITLSLISVWYN